MLNTSQQVQLRAINSKWTTKGLFLLVWIQACCAKIMLFFKLVMHCPAFALHHTSIDHEDGFDCAMSLVLWKRHSPFNKLLKINKILSNTRTIKHHPTIFFCLLLLFFRSFCFSIHFFPSWFLLLKVGKGTETSSYSLMMVIAFLISH